MLNRSLVRRKWQVSGMRAELQSNARAPPPIECPNPNRMLALTLEKYRFSIDKTNRRCKWCVLAKQTTNKQERKQHIKNKKGNSKQKRRTASCSCCGSTTPTHADTYHIYIYQRHHTYIIDLFLSMQWCLLLNAICIWANRINTDQCWLLCIYRIDPV